MNTSLSPEACLFVANLPANWSNDDLSYNLLETFRRFGSIISIKASRDGKGRPFGFVQFENSADALTAIKNKSLLSFGGRQIRIEKARCLRKVQVTLPNNELTAEKTKNLLSKYANLNDIVFLEYEEDDCNQDQKPSFIMKFYDHVNADDACKEIKKEHPTWEICWLNTIPESKKYNHGNISINNRQLYYYPNPNFDSNFYNSYMGYYGGMYNDPTCGQYRQSMTHKKFKSPKHKQEDTQMKNLIANVSKMNVDDTNEIDSQIKIIDSDEKENINNMNIRKPMNIKVGIEEHHEIFVGRLNSQKIEEEMISSRFVKYGELKAVNMFNKKSFGMPQDAFAFLSYYKYEDAKMAIEKENGKMWMGQAIKVTWAMPKQQSSSIRSNCQYNNTVNPRNKLLPDMYPQNMEDYQIDPSQMYTGMNYFNPHNVYYPNMFHEMNMHPFYYHPIMPQIKVYPRQNQLKS